MAATLRVVLGVDNAHKMKLSSGIPESMESLKEEIQRHFGLTEDFRLQYKDVDFGNEFVNLTTMADIADKSTIKVVYLRNFEQTVTVSSAASAAAASTSAFAAVSSTAASTASSSAASGPLLDSSSVPDTDILSSPDSNASCSSLRLNQWPTNFPIPAFSFDVQFQLERAQQNFTNNGTLLDLSPKLKSDILETLASQIAKYKVYPSNVDLDDVAEALIQKYPCLKESGSVTGCAGWKVSLKYKMSNYRTLLRNIGCPEVAINTLKHKNDQEESARNQVKKPRKAEVNFFPQYPAGQTKESMEEQRQVMLVELKKRNSEQIIKSLMDKTFAHRRREVIEEKPFISEFKSRWPALFTVTQINEEFTRITTVPLLSTFMGSFDRYSDQLMKMLRKRGGQTAQRINTAMSAIGQSSRIEVKRECILKALMIYLNETPQALIKEYLDVSVMESDELEQIDMGVYKIIHEGADADNSPEDVGVIIERCSVLQDLGDAATGCALLFGLIYCLNLSYPKTLRYTFEFFQKVLMGLDAKKMSNRIQVLKNRLCQN